MPKDECSEANTCGSLAVELRAVRESLKRIADIIQFTPRICRDEVGTILDVGITELSGQITQCEATLSAFQKNLQERELRTVKEYDDLAKKIREAHTKADMTIRKLPELPGVKIPHNIEKLFEIAERFDKLPDAQFTRVLELAVAMRTV